MATAANYFMKLPYNCRVAKVAAMQVGTTKSIVQYTKALPRSAAHSNFFSDSLTSSPVPGFLQGNGGDATDLRNRALAVRHVSISLLNSYSGSSVEPLRLDTTLFSSPLLLPFKLASSPM